MEGSSLVIVVVGVGFGGISWSGVGNHMGARENM